MTPSEIEKRAEDVALDCLRAIRKCRESGECSDRDIRQIIELRVDAALTRALTGVR